MLLFCATQVWAGGTGHAHAPEPTHSTGEAMRIASSSNHVDAVWRLPPLAGHGPASTTLYLADFETSAPLASATASLTLSGPGSLALDFAEASPGIYQGNADFPSLGEYAGALVVGTAAGAEVLALSEIRLTASDALADDGWGWLAVGVGVVVAGISALFLLGLGYAMGRARRAVAILFAVSTGVATERVWAHGGEDHGAPVGAGPSSDVLELPLESQFLLELRTQRVGIDAFQASTLALGHLIAQPGGSATVGAPMSGEFSAPNGGFPKPGDAVRAGQVLGVVRAVAGSGDRIALAAARQAAAGDLAEAIANLALAERDLEQSSTLGEAISQRERESRAGAAEVARVALREAQRALDATGDGLSVAVRAPVDGRLGAMLGRPGNTVAAGDGLFRVVDAAGMWIEARVPEALAPEISPGSEAVVITTALPSTPLSALVVDAGQEANPSTGSVLVTLALTAQVPGLLPGMSVSAWLPQGPARKATVVPDAAVLDSGGRSIAFVKVAPEEFVLRELRLGKRSGELWAVEEGLAAGERVVVAGNYALRSLAGR